ncbi:MAG: hypothetical protein ABIS86_06445 [Streptosporangiaceae bacterium]
MHRSVPAAIGVAALLTIAVDLAVLAGGGQAAQPADQQYSHEVAQVHTKAEPPITVAPLGRRHTPSLLIAARDALPAGAIAKVRKARGVQKVEIVDGAKTQIAGREVGLLGVDPSTFRNFAPKEVGKLDELWHNVASGDVVISFEGTRLGTTVSAGSPSKGASARVGAFAGMGVPGVQAVVSRRQAEKLGLAHGNAMIVSAPKADLAKLKKALGRVLPGAARISVLKVRAAAPVQVAHTARSPLSGTAGCSPHMQAVRNEIDALLGPFPAIGCYRGGDPQDHGSGNASDFMVAAGTVPGSFGRQQGDRAAAYAIQNYARLGIKYVIWQQHIWNPGVCRCWRPMGDRGSVTQNHLDHVHISVTG